MSSLSTTTNNLYQLYISSVVDCAQSMVIKFDQLAEATNKSVFLETGQMPDPNDRTSWKYYQNISGIYHFSDIPMRIYSLDSENQIDFTTANLAINPITRAAYAYASPLYNELLAQYPNQESLILGILSPTDLSVAIAARPGTILSYAKALVEPNEIDLIDKMQDWVYGYTNRWINQAYCLSDDLYVAGYYAQLCLSLVPLIMNLRLSACRTSRSHSFHSKQFLRSHGFLDVYLNQMTATQALYMVRNIAYHERNAGFEQTFNALVDVLMTQPGLPVYEYVMSHDTRPLQRATFSEVGLTPTAHFKRLALNKPATDNPAGDLSLNAYLAVSAPLLPNNPSYQENNHDAFRDRLDRATSAKLLTKTVECALSPNRVPTQYLPETLLFNQWVSLVATNRYKVPVQYLPVGASSALRLSHQEALAMWIYATSMAMSPTDSAVLERVPSIVAEGIVRLTVPEVNELYAMTDLTIVPRSTVDLVYGTAVQIPASVNSLIEFTSLCQQIYAANTQQYNLYSFQENPLARAQVQGAAALLYGDVEYRLNELTDPSYPTLGMTYTSLIQRIGLNVSNYRSLDFYNMAIAILNSATGLSANALLDPGKVQKAMVTLLTYLSSYSIQIVTTGQANSRVMVPRPDVRLYNAIAHENLTKLFEFQYSEHIRSTVMESTRVSISMPNLLIGKRASFVTSLNAQDRHTTPHRYVETTYRSIGYQPLIQNSTVYFDPASSFSALTTAQKARVADTYSTW